VANLAAKKNLPFAKNMSKKFSQTVLVTMEKNSKIKGTDMVLISINKYKKKF
jgi:hypothetical protein